MTQKKHVYVVLGMSRTGTSAIAKSMQVLGIALGNKLIEADERNPKGFYEDADVLYKINRGVSRAIDRKWLLENSAESSRLLAEPAVRQFKQLAVTLVSGRLASTANWGFKDPRTDTLLPFWREVFNAANVDDSYIIALRHPLATAHSSQKFIGIELEAALLLWLKHMFAVVDGTKGKNRVVISYETLMQSPRQQVERLHQRLLMPQPLSAEMTAQYADGFLDRDLTHHAYTDEEGERHPAMKAVPLCTRVHALLKRVASDEIDIDSDAFLQAWTQIKADYAAVEPAYAYIDSLLDKNKELKREIRSIHKALSWKMMFPLRKAEHALRTRRRDNKEKSRLWLTK